MDLKELSDRLSMAIEGVAEEERDAFIRGWIKNLPLEERESATVIYGIFRNKVPPKSKHVLVLVHGIRTAAVWHDLVQEVFEPTEIRVIPIGYEYHDAARFLWPFGRKKVVSYVQDQLRQVRADFPQAAISLIAHSFGTYIVSRILNSSSGYRLSKVIFCGSIVDAKFGWGQIQELPETRGQCWREVRHGDTVRAVPSGSSR
jgi:pimeloyl-ACP methyl ester carboxylesterase